MKNNGIASALFLAFFCILPGLLIRGQEIGKINAGSRRQEERIQKPQQHNLVRQSVEYSEKNIELPGAKTLCVPLYSSGCSEGDGFTDFAVAEIENYGSGCADNTGFDGWSQYLELGPAILTPGITYDFIMKTGYSNQLVTIWIDFNDDLELLPEEKVLIDFALSSAGQLYTAPVEIPLNSLPGSHIMRARTNWQSPASDPCEEYTYGEAEDYSVIIGTAAFGSLAGTVTEVAGGDPVEGATISLAGLYYYSTTTGTDGTYMFGNVMVGDYAVTCYKSNYNMASDSVTIEENVLITIDFQLTQPTIGVIPDLIEVILPPGITYQETITVENSGNGVLQWSAWVQATGTNTDDFLNLQFEYPVAGGSGESGIETDGNYIYTTRWNGNQFYRYAIDGTFLGQFTIDGVYSIRDMAWDGTFFYGGSALTTVYEMDLENQLLISSFTAPTEVRAIAYNEYEEVFYANNFDSPVVKFDKTGNYLGQFTVGPLGGNYYGFAFDNATGGGPYLWGYAQLGNSQNEIIQIQLPSGEETGLTLDVAELLTGPVWGSAGGLFTHPNLIYGKWTLGGLVQNEWIWGLELTDAQTWIGVYPNGGTIEAGSSEEITLLLETFDLLPGSYESGIHFTSFPDVGSPVTNVLLEIDMVIPLNLEADINCTNIDLNWNINPAASPDSFNVYRNNEWLATSYVLYYTDSLVYPDTLYSYYVTALFDGTESLPSNIAEAQAPLPDSLVPNLNFTLNGDTIVLFWNTPAACVKPAGYNVYRDNMLVGFTEDTTYSDNFGFYTYYITAIYYFGGFGPSNFVVITGTESPLEENPEVFPNPARDELFVQSPEPVVQFEIIDHAGKMILKKSVNNKNYRINISALKSGIYLLKLETKQGLFLQKILVE